MLTRATDLAALPLARRLLPDEIAEIVRAEREMEAEVEGCRIPSALASTIEGLHRKVGILASRPPVARAALRRCALLLVAAREDIPDEDLLAALAAEIDANPHPVHAALRRARLRPVVPMSEAERRVLEERKKGPFLTTDELSSRLPPPYRAALERALGHDVPSAAE